MQFQKEYSRDFWVALLIERVIVLGSGLDLRVRGSDPALGPLKKLY